MKKALFSLVILFAARSVQAQTQKPAVGLRGDSSYTAIAKKAQPYKMAVGLRLGYPTSISLKYLPSEKKQLELFAGYRGFTYYSWTMLGATYSKYVPIKEIEGLSWFAGGGASVYLWSWKSNWFGSTGAGTSFGILAHGGVDYRFKDMPLNLSLDWMPSFFLNGYGSGFAGGYGALSARYVFK
jgi:hypothetical protein